jgi:hypothetical protein
MPGSSSSIILCLLMSVFFSLLTPIPSERGRLMMFCLLYGIGVMGAKKSLEREIPEGETLSKWGQKRLFPQQLLKEYGKSFFIALTRATR